MKQDLSSETTVIRVLLIDDQTVVRAGLRILIQTNPGFTVVGEAGSLSDALTVASRERPDVILLDLLMDSESGLDYISQLHNAHSQARILVLTGVLDQQVHCRAVELGAMGVVLKTEGPEVLLRAIEEVYRGEAWLDRLTIGLL